MIAGDIYASAVARRSPRRSSDLVAAPRATLLCVRRYRFLLAPRWLAWHGLMVVCALGFLWLGRWQLARGLSGNLQSFAYAIEWPIFAGFAVFFWGKTIYGELHPEKQPVGSGKYAVPATGSSEVGGGGANSSAAGPGGQEQGGSPWLEEEPDSAMDAYNDYLAELNANPKLN